MFRIRATRLLSGLAFALCVVVTEARPATIVPGDLLIADPVASGPFGPGVVFKVDPSTGAQVILSSGGLFAFPSAVIQTSRSDIVVVDANAVGGSGAMILIDPGAGSQTILSSGGLFTHPQRIAESPEGNLLVLDPSGGPGHSGVVVKVDPTTGTQMLVSSGQLFVLPNSIAVSNDGTVYVSDGNVGIIKINPVTGAQSILSSGNTFCPGPIALAADGMLIVADLYQCALWQIERVDRDTGARSPLLGPSGAFKDISGLAVDQFGRVLISDSEAGLPTSTSTGEIFALDPETGGVTLVSSGGEFAFPTGLSIAGVRNGATATQRLTWGQVKDRYRK